MSVKPEKSRKIEKEEKMLDCDDGVQKVNKPIIIEFNDTKHYDAEDLKDYNPVYFFGCGRTVRTIIQKKILVQIILFMILLLNIINILDGRKKTIFFIY